VKTAAKPAAQQPTAVVPAEQPPKEVTHTIQMEDVQRDTLEVEEQKTVSDREVTWLYRRFLLFHLNRFDCNISISVYLFSRNKT